MRRPHPHTPIAALVAGGLWILGAAAGPVAGQQVFTVRGQVVDQEDGVALGGMVVTIRDRTAVTDPGGHFRFAAVAPGEHILRVDGIGYFPLEQILTVSSDTTVLIELRVSPVPLPPVVGVARWVRVDGRVREAANGIMMHDVRVFATPDIETRTSRAGRFRLRAVPAGVPLTIRAATFGFLPIVVTLEPQRDTTLEFAMVPDPVVQAMIAAQMERIDERADGHRYSPLPVLERDDLLAYRNWLVPEIIDWELGPGMSRRVACVVLDEESVEDSFILRERYRTLTPLEVHRVEVTDYPGMARALMLRVYTRDFVQRMVNDQVDLVPAELAMRRWAGRCR